MAGVKGMHRRTLHPRRAEELREKIRAALILKRLEDHTLGEIVMEQSQITSGLGLLKKCLPDLSNVEMTGKAGGPVEMIARWKPSK